MALLRSVLQVFRLTDLIFFGFAGLTLAGALGTALSRNLVYSAFSLLATLFGVAALFGWLSADYLAITQLIIYIGGVLVLFLFAVMLTNRITDVSRSNPRIRSIPAILLAAAIATIGILVAVKTRWRLLPTPVHRETTAGLGDLLLSTYLLPFEALSILILGALVGAVIMARKEVQD